MSKFRIPLLLAAAILAMGGWYWFRPERAFIDVRVSEQRPGAASVVASGRFEPRAHKAHGRAELLRLPDGRTILRFSDFETLNGPDVRVYLLRTRDANNNRDLAAGFVDLGALKGNVGDQNYVIPPDAGIADFQAVSVWCRRFGVNFATAALEPGDGS